MVHMAHISLYIYTCIYIYIYIYLGLYLLRLNLLLKSDSKVVSEKAAFMKTFCRSRNLSELVQMRPNSSKFVQICPNFFDFVQICANLSKFGQLRSEFVQTCPNFSKFRRIRTRGARTRWTTAKEFTTDSKPPCRILGLPIWINKYGWVCVVGFTTAT